MPQITTATPKTSITIAKHPHTVFQPYAAGHTLTAGEASALNQVFAENVRNNKAKALQVAVGDGTYDAAAFQTDIDNYQLAYNFGERQVGVRTGDPVRREAMEIARDKISKAIVAQGHKLSDVSAKQVSSLASELLDSPQGAPILALAQKRVDEAKSLASVDVGTLTFEAKAPQPASEEKGTKKAATSAA